MKNVYKIAFGGLVFLFVSIAAADVQLAAILSDNMVMQRETEAPVWGWADPGERITVQGSWKAEAIAVADADGLWSLKIKTPEAGGPYTLTVRGNNSIKLENVMIGEVWICSGQSNMGFALKKSRNGKESIAKANCPNIRLFFVKHNATSRPMSDCEGSWSECSPETVPLFSAVGYYFGRQLYDELRIPIGLIKCAWGGSPARAWTRKEILQSYNTSSPTPGPHDREAEKLRLAATKKRLPSQPAKPSKISHKSPSVLYNGMISPLIPYAIKGVIWYQGEANVGHANGYRKLFPAMITNWRDDWGQGDFPFYYVQLAPFNYNKGRASQKLREAQMLTLSLKNTGMAVTLDLGQARNIHPVKKLNVGKRLSLWALAKDYGKEDLVFSGPIYKSMKVEGDKIRLSFDYTGTGLKTRDGRDVSHLAIAGADKRFVKAKGVIDGDTVVVFSDTISKPVAVRYGWSNTANPNLANKEGLPASSFRTDFEVR